jgi:glycosyltransferase involved in cell wall biosynthesis
LDSTLVSICLPIYNGEKYLLEALESIGSQDYGHIEVIISDDKSSDASLEIIRDFFQGTTIDFKILNHEPAGIGSNWNNCIEHAKGDYIKFLFQDDVLEANCISHMVDVLEKDKTIDICVCKRSFINERKPPYDYETQRFLTYCSDLQSGLNLPKDHLVILDKNLFKNPEFYSSPKNKIGEPIATLFRKSLFDKIGLYRTDMKQILDYEIYYRALKHCKIAILNEALVRFRIHEMQASQENFGKALAEYKAMDQELYESYWPLLSWKKKLELWMKFHPIAVKVEQLLYRLRN